MMKNFKPSKEDLRDATNRTTEDLIDHDLKVLFCGINPGIWSGATGFHFAKPGNRFWKALHLAGFTNRLLHPSEEYELLENGFGITSFVKRTTSRAVCGSMRKPFSATMRRMLSCQPSGVLRRNEIREICCLSSIV